MSPWQVGWCLVRALHLTLKKLVTNTANFYTTASRLPDGAIISSTRHHRSVRVWHPVAGACSPLRMGV